MSDRALFFNSISTLYNRCAIGALKYLLEEIDCFDVHCDCVPNGMRHLMACLNRQGVVLYVAPEIADRLGRTPQQMRGKNFFSFLPDRKRAEQWALHHEAVTTGRMVHFHYTGVQGHRYDALFVPVFRKGQVSQILGFAAEREFIEILPDGMARPI